MPKDIWDYANRLVAVKEAEDVVTLRQAVLDALALSGVGGVYLVAPLTADPRLNKVLANRGLSRIWERHYRARLHKIDPLLRISLEKSSSFCWPEGIADIELTSKEERYMKIIARFGMARGMGVACYGPHGRSGFMGVAWPFDHPPEEKDLQHLQIVGQTSFQRYCHLVKSDAAIPVLSNRELEVLSWMGEGKSNSVIAQILGISRSSVDIYVRRIFAKLGVADRTAATLQGYSLGLTAPGHLHELLGVAHMRDADEAK